MMKKKVFKRPCKNCPKMFVPEGKYDTLCKKCYKEKTGKNRVKNIQQLNFGGNNK